ncbi:hypothetical protein QLH51_05705 [Sphingomonas sp. 2R-10]|uniref:hypothetical protein n=1 Tax=Sphingomonas sp. 2R-10 TaxID=3045148 RepID=UPI0024BA5333|nr:hypothetical protein [Sphingomonas sp. 2R-10]MDJ0276292.1 hypothetical protein [Sphingomonas sp. 2R-10]
MTGVVERGLDIDLRCTGTAAVLENLVKDVRERAGISPGDPADRLVVDDGMDGGGKRHGRSPGGGTTILPAAHRSPLHLPDG